jgi:N-acetylglucosamine-6-sulfatase
VTLAFCCPSRSTIVAGRDSHGTGVYGNSNGQPTGGWNAFKHDESSTVATWLHGAGYRTALIREYLNGYGAR